MASTHLIQRGGIYWYRRAVPFDLRHFIPKTQIWKTTGCRTRTDALVLSRRWSAAFDKLIYRLRSGLLLNTEAQRAVQEFLHTFIDCNERKRRENKPDAGMTDEQLAKIYERRMAGREGALGIVQRLEHGQALGMLSDSARGIAGVLVRCHDLKIESGTSEFEELCREVQKNYITMWKTEAEHAVGNYDTPYDMARRVSEAVPEADKPLLSELIDKYIQTRHKAQKAARSQNVKTVNGYRAMLALFIEIVGDKPANHLTMDDVDRYLEVIQQLPSNMKKAKRYRDLGIDEILNLDEVVPMSGQTIKNNLRQAKSYCAWLANRGYTVRDVAADHSYSPDDLRKESEQRAEYSADDIQRMVDGFLAERSRTPRRFMSRPERFWVPLLCLFGGFRLEEACQLLVADVKQVHGVWCIDCNWYDDKGEVVKRFKTKNAKRVQPIHQTVLDLGFVEYVEGVKAGGSLRLFPLLTPRPSDNNKVGGNLSAWWNGQKGSYKGFSKEYVSTDKDKVFHSTRHNFCTAVEHPGMSDRMLSDLMGHAKKTVASKRYFKGHLVNDKLVEINRIDYGVDFVGQLGHWNDWH